MKIVSLIENTSKKDNLKCEHGLSLYIEALGRKIIFDLGQTELVFENAKSLGLDLSQVDIAVISHGHYDHGGGLKKFFELNRRAKVYIREEAFLPYYHGERYIGIDRDLENHERIIKTHGDTSLYDGLTILSLDTPPYSGDGLTVEKNGIRMPDFFEHEQYLLIEEGDRRVLISGCSHKGILQIVEHFKPNLLVGGFHFMNMPLDEDLAEAAKKLSKSNCRYYTCHCTGTEQFEFIKKYIYELEYLSAGDRIEV